MEAFLSQIQQHLEHSPLFALLAAYIGGVLASLTPCIYPMIPITAGVIGHANVGGSRLRGLLLSMIYVAGMACTYAILGIFAAATGRFFGSVSTNPWTHVIVGNILLLFSLWMLDVFQAPMFTHRLNSGHFGLTGIFLAGISAALVAGPCTTPVLGALLTYTASSQNIMMGGGLLFVFSLGLGTLLLGIGAFSSFLASLPRSGPWMNTIKKSMGLMMLGLAQYFFIKAGTFFF